MVIVTIISIISFEIAGITVRLAVSLQRAPMLPQSSGSSNSIQLNNLIEIVFTQQSTHLQHTRAPTIGVRRQLNVEVSVVVGGPPVACSGSAGGCWYPGICPAQAVQGLAYGKESIFSCVVAVLGHALDKVHIRNIKNIK